MITYKQIASREDKNFHRIARKVLGNDYGVTDWTNIDAPQIKRQVVKSNFVPQKVKDRKFNSRDGLWSNKI